MYAASEELIIEASDFNDDNTDALRTIGMLMLATSQGKVLSELDETERSIMPRFRDPSHPSSASLSDAMVKQASVASWLPETRVFWEQLGYSEEQIERMMSEKRKSQGRGLLAVDSADTQAAGGPTGALDGQG
jgi:uncharacterized protein YbaP (TraB family)